MQSVVERLLSERSVKLEPALAQVCVSAYALEDVDLEVGMLIDPFCTDLIAGYKEIKLARQALLKKWRFELLRAYSRRREAYQQQLARREARKEQYQRALPFIAAALFLVVASDPG